MMKPAVKSYKYTKEVIKEVKAYKCPCGKAYLTIPSAENCCNNHICEKCGENKVEYSWPRLCKGCLNDRQQEAWDKSEKVEWNDCHMVFSDLCNEYWDESDVEYHWEEDFPEEDFNWKKASEYYQLYLCKPFTPNCVDMESYFSNYIECDDCDDSPELPEGWQEVEKVMNDYIKNANWPLVMYTRTGLK